MIGGGELKKRLDQVDRLLSYSLAEVILNDFSLEVHTLADVSDYVSRGLDGGVRISLEAVDRCLDQVFPEVEIRDDKQRRATELHTRLLQGAVRGSLTVTGRQVPADLRLLGDTEDPWLLATLLRKSRSPEGRHLAGETAEMIWRQAIENQYQGMLARYRSRRMTNPRERLLNQIIGTVQFAASFCAREEYKVSIGEGLTEADRIRFRSLQIFLGMIHDKLETTFKQFSDLSGAAIYGKHAIASDAKAAGDIQRLIVSPLSTILGDLQRKQTLVLPTAERESVDSVVSALKRTLSVIRIATGIRPPSGPA